MKLVAAGFGDVGNLHACLLTILAGIRVGNNRGLLQVILAQGQVGGAGVVQVQERIHVILTVDGENVGSSGQTRGLEVAIAHAGIHVDAGGRLGHVGNVVTAVGLIGDEVLIEVGR